MTSGNRSKSTQTSENSEHLALRVALRSNIVLCSASCIAKNLASAIHGYGVRRAEAMLRLFPPHPSDFVTEHGIAAGYPNKLTYLLSGPLPPEGIWALRSSTPHKPHLRDLTLLIEKNNTR